MFDVTETIGGYNHGMSALFGLLLLFRHRFMFLLICKAHTGFIR